VPGSPRKKRGESPQTVAKPGATKRERGMNSAMYKSGDGALPGRKHQDAATAKGRRYKKGEIFLLDPLLSRSFRKLFPSSNLRPAV